MVRMTSSALTVSLNHFVLHLFVSYSYMEYSTTHFEEGLQDLPLKEISVMWQKLTA